MFERRRREDQEGQATQRQSTDSLACQGKILSQTLRDPLGAIFITNRVTIRAL